MPLTNLDINNKAPKNLSDDTNDEEDELEIELLSPEDNEEEDFDEDKWEDENDEEEEDTELDEDEEENEEDDDELDDSEDDSDDEEDNETSEERVKETRENDRIRTLVQERNTATETANTAKKESLQVQKQMVEMQKVTVDNQKKFLGTHVKSLQAQMVTAKEADENEKYVELHAELNDAQMNLKALESWNAPEVPEDITNSTDDGDKGDSFEDAPQVVHDWAAKNTWFRNPQSPKDRERQKEALLYSEVLVSDGYTVESEGFFDMVDKRLKLLGLAKKTKNKVNSKSKDKTSSKRRKKKISQTVQGASRTSASRKKSKNKVTLTPEQQDIAHLYGMTNLEYAKELMAIEESEKAGNRMTTLKL